MRNVINKSRAFRNIPDSLGADGAILKGCPLLPGANQVSDAHADLVKGPGAIPYLSDLCERGILILADIPKPTIKTFDPSAGAYVADLSALTQGAAMDAISACKDITDLQRWLDQDSRPDVKVALISRGIEIREGKAGASAAGTDA